MMKKTLKKMLVLALAVVMCCGSSISAVAAEKEEGLPENGRYLEMAGDESEDLEEGIQPREPAPGLSSITITRLLIDENNKVLIEVEIMGTAKSVLCWCNNTQCTQDFNRITSITSGNKVIGSRRYFKTNISRAEVESGIVLNMRAQATNAVSPWNTLTTSWTVSLPQ